MINARIHFKTARDVSAELFYIYQERAAGCWVDITKLNNIINCLTETLSCLKDSCEFKSNDPCYDKLREYTNLLEEYIPDLNESIVNFDFDRTSSFYEEYSDFFRLSDEVVY